MGNYSLVGKDGRSVTTHFQLVSNIPVHLTASSAIGQCCSELFLASPLWRSCAAFYYTTWRHDNRYFTRVAWLGVPRTVTNCFARPQSETALGTEATGKSAGDDGVKYGQPLISFREENTNKHPKTVRDLK